MAAVDVEVDFQILGPVRVVRGGVEVGVGGIRRTALLALLIIHRGEVVSADRIADAIWDGRPPSGASGTLQSHVSHLRRCLGPDAGVVVTHRPGYVLKVAASSVDGYRFEELGERGRTLAAGEDHAAALACYDAALAMWQGRPLVDLAGFEFAEREADRLEQVRISVEQYRIDSILAVGGHGTVVGPLTTLVDNHPFRERLVGQLMLALFREGRQADALRVFDRARVALRDGLGLDPSSELRELQGAILRQEPALQAARSGLHLRSSAGDVERAAARTVMRVARTIPTGTVTFLFSDIEGSSGLWEQAGSAMAAALARHDEIVRAAIDRHGGWIFSVGGDGFGAAFARAADGLASAIDAQRALQQEAWPRSVELRVRMGMHTGEAQERDGTYFGHAVNVAARLMAAAAGGQIIVSEVTAAIIGDVTAAELVDLGRQRLRGLVDPVRASCVKAEGLAWVDRPLAVRDAFVGRLPRPATSWRGPVTLLDRLGADLSTDRLMTFTGPGGIGKSRLAIEVAGRSAGGFADGVWMVELAPIADPGSVVTAIASVFSLHPPAGVSPDDALVEWLRDRHLLLILDNGEHVLAVVRSVVVKIMDGCPHVTTVVTSRVRLELVGERVVVVPMLAMRDAVELFEDCSAAVGGPTKLPEADQDGVVSICERLDGIPLAIELAASRTRSLSVMEVLRRLDDRFRLLTRGRHGAVEHHQTLRATVDWSYQLLSDAERELFVRLSVFPGGFDLAAVEAVCADEMLDQSAIVDLVDALVAKSMVVADRHRAGIRYRLLETLRDYAREQRPGHVDEDALRSRHLDHYLAVAKYAYDKCAGPHQVHGDNVLDQEWDNLRAAHSWALETKAVGAAYDIVALTGHHAFRRYRHEHEVWATMTDSVGPLTSSPTCHGWAARWALLAGDLDRALELVLRGIEVAREPGDPDATRCWAALASVQLATGDSASAWQSAMKAVTSAANGPDPFIRAEALSAVIEAALSEDAAVGGKRVAELRSLAERVGAPSLLARSWYHAGQQHLNEPGDPDASAARTAYAEGLALAERVGDLFMAQMSLYGVVEATTAMRVDSSRLGVEALTEFRERRNWLGTWALLNALAEWLAFARDAEGAATIFGHLEAHHHLPWDTPVVRQRRSSGLSAVRGHPSAEQWMAHGAGMDRDGVVTYAIARLAERARSTED